MLWCVYVIVTFTLPLLQHISYQHSVFLSLANAYLPASMCFVLIVFAYTVLFLFRSIAVFKKLSPLPRRVFNKNQKLICINFYEPNRKRIVKLLAWEGALFGGGVFLVFLGFIQWCSHNLCHEHVVFSSCLHEFPFINSQNQTIRIFII